MWKQPIPVDIQELQDNKFAETIFQKILLECNREDKEVNTERGLVVLHRGECLFGRGYFNSMLGLPVGSQKIEKMLEKSPFLNRWVNRSIIHGVGSVLKVEDYDGWSDLNRYPNTEQTQSKHKVNTPKEYKNIRIEDNNIKQENGDKPNKRVRKKPTLEVDPQYLVSLRKQFPDIDVTAEWDACQLWWQGSGKTMKNQRLALLNWLKNHKKWAEEKEHPKERLYFADAKAKDGTVVKLQSNEPIKPGAYFNGEKGMVVVS